MKIFFTLARKLRIFGKNVEQKVLFRYNKQLKLSCSDVLLGFDSENETDKIFLSYVNLLILIAKMCIGIVRYHCPMDIEDLYNQELRLRNV